MRFMALENCNERIEYLRIFCQLVLPLHGTLTLADVFSPERAVNRRHQMNTWLMLLGL